MVVKKDKVITEDVAIGGTSIKSIVALGVVALSLFGGGFLINKHYDQKIQNAMLEINKLQTAIKDVQNKNDKIIQQAAYTDVEGLTGARMDADKKVIVDFFKPVFQYSSGEAYDAQRAKMISLLGESNSVLEYYMPENEKIDNSTKVDLEGTKRQYRGIELYPVKKETRGFSYIAIIDFVYYKDEKDLQHLRDLQGSHAIIRCSVIEVEKGKFTVNSVTGYGGY